MINESAFQQTIDSIYHMPEGSTALDQARFVWEQCEKACAPKVKALEWVEEVYHRNDADPIGEVTGYSAETAFGTFYEIDLGVANFNVMYDFTSLGDFETEQEVKAAAQADYEKRILSALEARL